MANLDRVLKSRDITLPTKVSLVKAMVFPVDVKAGPQRRLNAKELMLLNCGAGRLLRVPWTARRSSWLILKEINPEYSLKGLMLKLKPHYFGHLMQRTDSFEKTLMLEKIEGGRRKGMTENEMLGWPHRLNGHEFEQAL